MENNVNRLIKLKNDYLKYCKDFKRIQKQYIIDVVNAKFGSYVFQQPVQIFSPSQQLTFNATAINSDMEIFDDDYNAYPFSDWSIDENNLHVLIDEINDEIDYL